MKIYLTSALALLFAAAICGCEDAPTESVADNHDDHDHEHGNSAPESFGEAFHQLEEMREVGEEHIRVLVACPFLLPVDAEVGQVGLPTVQVMQLVRLL